MQKRRLSFGLILGIFTISFVSAYYGSYGNFSITNLLDSIDPATMFLGIVFFLCLGFINFSLGKTIGKNNRMLSGFMSFLISLGIVYGLNRTNMDFSNFFYKLGISGSSFSTFTPIILLIVIVLLFWKFKTKALLILGALLIILSFTDIYAKGASLLLGIIIFIVGLVLVKKKPNNNNLSPTSQQTYNPYQNYSNSTPQRTIQRNIDKQQKALLKQEKKQAKYDEKIKQKRYEAGIDAHNKEVKRRAQNIENIKQKRQEKFNKIQERQKDKINQEIKKEQIRGKLEQRRKDRQIRQQKALKKLEKRRQR